MSDGAVNGGAGNARVLPRPLRRLAAARIRGWVVALVCGVLPAALLTAIVAVPAALWSRRPTGFRL